MSTFQPEQQPRRMGEDWTPPRPPVIEKQRGAPPCLLYGAIGCLVVFVFLVIAGVFAFFGIKSWFAGLVEEYTDTAPAELPLVEVSDAEATELIARADAFTTAVSKGEAALPLALTQQDINALIQHHPNWKELKGKVHVSIEDDILGGQISIPLEGLGFDIARGRYLNGSAKFNVFLRDGMLFINLVAAEVRGKALPEEFIAGFQNQNLAEEARDNPDIAELLDKLDRIEVEDNTLIITPKSSSAKGVAEAPENAAPVEPEHAEAEPSDADSASETQPAATEK